MSAARRWSGLGPGGWAAGLLGLGTLPLAGAWADWRAVPILIATTVVLLATTRLALRAGAGRVATALVLVALLLLAAYLLGAPAETTFAQTVIDAIPRLLGQPLPLAMRPELLATPVLLTGLTAVLVALRLDSPTRLVPVVGAVVLYLAGQLLTTGSADPHGLVAALILVVALAGWLLLDTERRPSGRRLGQLAPAVAGAVGLLAACSVLPVRHPFEPREFVRPPITVVELSSPLPRIAAWNTNPDVELFTATGDAVPLRLAVLDTYDGAQWLAATEYSPIGTPGIDTLEPGRRQSRLRERIRVSALGGSWLPSPGQVESVTGADALVDPGTGSVYASGIEPGLTYDVDAVLDDPDPEELKGATVPTTGPFRRYLELPPLPLEIATYGDKITASASTPYSRALAIEGSLRRGPKLSSRAISGSALWRLQAFLVGTEGDPGARVGTSEQFATAFAVLARHSGLPTRVVVGFRPGKPLDDGSRLIRGRDALAWPEVYFEGLGWVPFSPTPNDDTFLSDRPQPEDDPLNPVPVPDADTLPPPAEAEPAATSEPTLPWATLLGTGLAVVVATPVLVLLLLRWRRRLRHRRAGSTGGWAEILDGLVLAGSRGPGDESAPEIARRLERDLGSPAAGRVADAAERRAFGPTTTLVEPDRFPAAEVREVRRLLRRSLPLWRRAWWTFDHRVLRRPRARG